MVCREVRETGRGTSRRGSRGIRSVLRRAAPPIRPFFVDMGMRPVCNPVSGAPGGVPNAEVNPHLGNPGLKAVTMRSATVQGMGLDPREESPDSWPTSF